MSRWERKGTVSERSFFAEECAQPLAAGAEVVKGHGALDTPARPRADSSAKHTGVQRRQDGGGRQDTRRSAVQVSTTQAQGGGIAKVEE